MFSRLNKNIERTIKINEKTIIMKSFFTSSQSLLSIVPEWADPSKLLKNALILVNVINMITIANAIITIIILSKHKKMDQGVLFSLL